MYPPAHHSDISSPGSEILIPFTDTNSEAKHPPFPYCPFSGSPNPFSLLYYKSTPRRVIEAMENTSKDFEMAITHLPAHLCRHCGLSYPSSLQAEIRGVITRAHVHMHAFEAESCGTVCFANCLLPRIIVQSGRLLPQVPAICRTNRCSEHLGSPSEPLLPVPHRGYPITSGFPLVHSSEGRCG